MAKSPAFEVGVTRNRGGLFLTLTAICQDACYERVYIGYDEQEARREFRQHVEEQLEEGLEAQKDTRSLP